MEYTTLGQTTIKVSRLGFGGCPMGGHGWGRVDHQDLLNAIAFALDHGINFFDTADVYGLGKSEAILGEGIRGRRDKAVIATKFGVRVENGKTFYDNSPQWFRHALDGSLKRLGTDYIDLYQLHYWDGHTKFDDVIDAVEVAKQQGKIRTWGVTNVEVTPAFRAKAGDALVSFSNEFSLAKRKFEDEVMPTARNAGLTFLSWGSLGQGILSGKYDAGHKFDEADRRTRAVYVNFSEEGRERNLRTVAAMREIQPRYPSRTLPQIALRWILDYVPRSVALVGVKTLDQIKANAGALGWSLSAADMAKLDAVSATVAVPDQAVRNNNERPNVQAHH